MFQSIVDAISGSAWSYGIVFAVAMIDAFFPLVPSEATVITAGVLAGSGDLQLGLVIAAAAIGAICGDNVCYWLGRIFGERLADRYFTGERRRHLDRAHRMLEERGGWLIIIGRFIPGGRTAVTFSCGYTHAMRWRRFIVADVIAGVLWACYAALLGYWGGKRFEDAPWKGLLIAFGIAVAASAVIELARRLRAKWVAPTAE
jgi:membrane protein DedA with SNARE-associated domain